MLSLERVERFVAVVDRVEATAAALERATGDDAVDLTVLDNEH
jgi:hypothetical protein